MIYRTEVIASEKNIIMQNSYLNIFSFVYSLSGNAQNSVNVSSPFEFITFFPDFQCCERLSFLKDMVDIGYSLTVKNLHVSTNYPSLRLYRNPEISTTVNDKDVPIAINSTKNIAIKVNLEGWSRGSFFLLYQKKGLSGYLVWCGEPGDPYPIDSKSFYGDLRITPGTNAVEEIKNGLGLNSSFMTEIIDDKNIGIGSPNEFFNLENYSGIGGIDFYPWLEDKIIAAASKEDKVIDFTSKTPSDFSDLYVRIVKNSDQISIGFAKKSAGLVTLEEFHSGSIDEVLESIKLSTIVDVVYYGGDIPAGEFHVKSLHKKDPEYNYNSDIYIKASEELETNILPDYVFDYYVQHVKFYEILRKKFDKSIKIFKYIDKVYYLDMYYADGALPYIMKAIYNNEFGEVSAEKVMEAPYSCGIKSGGSFFYIDPPFYWNTIKMVPIAYNFVTYILRSLLLSQISLMEEVSFILDECMNKYSEVSGRDDRVTIDSMELVDNNSLVVNLNFSIEDLKDVNTISLKITTEEL